MKSPHSICALAAIVAACLSPRAEALVIAESMGTDDPTTTAAPWFAAQQGMPTAGPASDNASWQVVVPNPGRLNYNLYDDSLDAFHAQPLSLGHFNDPSGWTMTATAKVNDVRNRFDLSMEVMDGTSRWFWSITNDGAGWLNNGAALVPLGDINTSVFQTYQLVQQPGAVGEVEMYLNGFLVHTQTAAQVLTSAPFMPDTGRAYFGDNINSSGFTSDFQISELRFETGVNIVEPSFTPGDTDGDNDVDTSDLQTLLDNFFVTDPPPGFAQGNFNFDSTVDVQDFLIWSDAFAASNPGAVLGDITLPTRASVPEPTTTSMVVFGAGSLLRLLRRRVRS